MAPQRPFNTLQMRPIKQEIDKIHSEEVEKKIRYMEQWFYEAGPKAAQLLPWRLRQQQAERTIHKIRDPTSNTIITELERIQKSFETYYRSLCTQPEKASGQHIELFLNPLNLPTLSNDHNDELTSQTSSEETDEVISSLNSGKSPGTDGFPPECYKSMRESLLALLTTCFNYIMAGGSLPPSWGKLMFL